MMLKTISFSLSSVPSEPWEGILEDTRMPCPCSSAAGLSQSWEFMDLWIYGRGPLLPRSHARGRPCGPPLCLSPVLEPLPSVPCSRQASKMYLINSGMQIPGFWGGYQQLSPRCSCSQKVIKSTLVTGCVTRRLW